MPRVKEAPKTVFGEQSLIWGSGDILARGHILLDLNTFPLNVHCALKSLEIN